MDVLSLTGMIIPPFKQTSALISIFTARRYASAVLAMALYLSVSVTSRCSIKTAERIELVFGM